MKKLRIVCAVVSLAGAGALAWAEDGCGRGGPEPRGGGMKSFGPGGGGIERLVRDEAAAKNLGVTEAQLAQLREITYQGEIQQIKVRADLEIAQMELRRLLDTAKPTEEAVGKAIDKISALEAQMQKARIGEMLKVREILGEEMMAKLRDTMRDQMRERAMDRDRERGHRGDRPGSRREMGRGDGQSMPPQAPAEVEEDEADDDAGK